MKINLLLILLVFMQVSRAGDHHVAAKAPKVMDSFVFVPGGAIGDTVLPEFYISATEVTNRQYREFIDSLRASGDAAGLRVAMVDTTRWNYTAFADFYFQNKAYDEYPVVCISRRAAEMYCQWLTQKVRKEGKTKAEISLPTEKQWEYAAQGGYSRAIYPWAGTSVKYQKKGKYYQTYLGNFKRTEPVTSVPDTAKKNIDITAPARSYIPNTYDIYNMGGNVAEMISDHDYTKGGSYNSPEEMVLIAAHEDYNPAVGSPFIGFRPMMKLNDQ